MKICSGDIVTVKNITFNNGAKDTLKAGRTAVILYSYNENNKDYAKILLLSKKVDNLKYNIIRERYITILKTRGPYVIDLDDPIIIEINSNIGQPQFNIGNEYFELATKFTDNSKKVKGLSDNGFETMMLENRKELKTFLFNRQIELVSRRKDLTEIKTAINSSEMVNKKSGSIKGHYKKKTLELKRYKDEDKNYLNALNNKF